MCHTVSPLRSSRRIRGLALHVCVARGRHRDSCARGTRPCCLYRTRAMSGCACGCRYRTRAICDLAACRYCRCSLDHAGWVPPRAGESREDAQVQCTLRLVVATTLVLLCVLLLQLGPKPFCLVDSDANTNLRISSVRTYTHVCVVVDPLASTALTAAF